MTTPLSNPVVKLGVRPPRELVGSTSFLLKRLGWAIKDSAIGCLRGRRREPVPVLRAGAPRRGSVQRSGDDRGCPRVRPQLVRRPARRARGGRPGRAQARSGRSPPPPGQPEAGRQEAARGAAGDLQAGRGRVLRAARCEGTRRAARPAARARGASRPAVRACTPPTRLDRVVKDLREWIALLEREGELVRVGAEVDPQLEVTEIVDRTVKAGGPALLFERPEGKRRSRCSSTSSGPSGACASPSASSRSTTSRRSSADMLEMQPPEGLAAKVRGLQTLKSIADSRPRSVKRGACQEVVLRGDEVDLGLLPVQTCWPGDAGPFITLPAVITRDPRTGQRNVGMYRMQVLGPRSTAMHWQLHKDGRADYLFSEGRMEVAVALGPRPGHGLLRERAAAEAHRRADVRRLPARRAGRAREGRHRRPRGAGRRRDRARGLRRAGRPRDRGPVRRPHRLLHAGRAVPRLPRHGADDAARRHLPVDRRRQAAAGGRLARQGDRADLPAGRAR